MTTPANLAVHIALRYLRLGRRAKLVSFMSALAVGSLAFSTAVLITVLSVLNGFDHEMRVSVLGIVPHITVRGQAEPTPQEWQEAIARIARHDQVEDVEGIVAAVAVIATPRMSQGVAVTGIRVDAGAVGAKLDRYMRAGSSWALAEARWQILLGADLAARLGVGRGDTVELFATTLNRNPLAPLATFRRFQVGGLYRVGNQALDGESAFIALPDARALFRQRSQYSGLQVTARDALAAPRLADTLARALPGGFELGDWTALFGAIYENIRFSRNLIALLLWLLVAVAAFNLVVSLVMIVRDKRADIAILRTLGASPAFINRLFLWQGAFIGLLGLGLGLGLGILGALTVSDLAAVVEAALGIKLLNAAVYPIDFLPSRLAIADLATVGLGVLALTLLATLYPARRAAAMAPAAALRKA